MKMSKRSTILSQAGAREGRKQHPAVTNVNACVTKYHHWTNGILRQSQNIFCSFVRGSCDDNIIILMIIVYDFEKIKSWFAECKKLLPVLSFKEKCYVSSLSPMQFPAADVRSGCLV